jgi:HEAT repeat protein
MLGMAMARDERAVLPLLSVLNNPEEKEDMRAMAATAVGKAGFCETRVGKRTLNVVETLARLLSAQSTRGSLKISVILSLSALGPSGRMTPERLMALVERTYAAEKNGDVRSYLLLGVAELAKKGPLMDPARALLRKALKEESTPPALPFACAGAGLAKDPEAVGELRRIFETKKDPESRGAAAISLGLLEDAQSAPAILKVLAGKAPPSLKEKCCLALGLMGCKDDKSVLDALREILEKGKNPSVRGTAGMALMLLDVSNALDVLLRVLKEGGSYLRQSLIMTLGYSRDLRAARPLMELFDAKDVSDEVRAMIATALGYLIEEAEEPVLKRVSKHYNLMLTRFDGIMQIMALL